MNYYDIVSDKKTIYIPFEDQKLKVVYDSTKVNRYLLENKEKNDNDYIDKTLSSLIVEWDLTDREGNIMSTEVKALGPLNSALKNTILFALINDGTEIKKK